jgi:uncharacterized membrane protein (DUF106 family)
MKRRRTMRRKKRLLLHPVRSLSNYNQYINIVFIYLFVTLFIETVDAMFADKKKVVKNKKPAAKTSVQTKEDDEEEEDDQEEEETTATPSTFPIKLQSIHKYCFLFICL